MNCSAMTDTNLRNDDLVTVPLYDYCEDISSKENVLSFSFDHIYAITPDNVTFLQPQPREIDECSAGLDRLCNQQSQTQKEIDSLKRQLKNTRLELKKLKKLTSVHLDLIQRQSFIVTSKEKHIRALSLENEVLRSINVRQRQNPPPLVSIPPKPPANSNPNASSKSLLIQEGVQRPNKQRKLNNPETSQPGTSGYVPVKKPTHTASKSDTFKSDLISKEAEISGQASSLDLFPQNVEDIPIYDPTTNLSSASVLDGIDCVFDKTDFDIYTTETQHITEVPSAYDNIDIGNIKIKEEILESGDIFSDDTIVLPKVEKSCRDFSYGESLSNISSGVLSTLSDTKPSTSQKTLPWWQQTADMVSSDYVDDSKAQFAETIVRKKPLPKGKGKGKGKRSVPMETSGGGNSETTNALIRNMFIAPDPEIPEKVSASYVEEPKVKNRFFRSKLTREIPCTITRIEDDPGAVYTFDAQDDQKDNKKDIYKHDIDVFDFCISQQDAEPSLSEMPSEPKRKKHIYDPPTKGDMTKELKRATSPSASVYSFEDSQETKMLDKIRAISPDYKSSKHYKSSRAFGVFGPSSEISSSSMTFDSKKSRRKSTTAANSSRVSAKSSNARSRANSLYCSSNSAYQRNSFVGASKRGRQRAMSTGSHTSAGSRSKSSCDINLSKLSVDMELKNRNYTMISQPEYDFINVGRQPVPETTPINTLEVPKWRIKTLKPTKASKSEIPEEKLDDIVFAKRHTKMELEEKRIKRWDYQRLKEQLHLKKLKERQEKLNPGGKRLLYKSFKQRKVIPQSLWPNSEDVLAIEVVDKLPVCSFGELVPFYKPRQFSLPWVKKGRPRADSERKNPPEN